MGRKFTQCGVVDFAFDDFVLVDQHAGIFYALNPAGKTHRQPT